MNRSFPDEVGKGHFEHMCRYKKSGKNWGMRMVQCMEDRKDVGKLETWKDRLWYDDIMNAARDPKRIKGRDAMRQDLWLREISHCVEDRMQFKVEGSADVAGVPVREARRGVESRGWGTSEGDGGRSGKEGNSEPK